MVVAENSENSEYSEYSEYSEPTFPIFSSNRFFVNLQSLNHYNLIKQKQKER